MEDNNDFEKYEGYKDSVETLLGTNEKSSSMSSRERLDEAVDEAGAEFLSSKMKVPKGLAKKAIKEDGGKFAPTHGPTQKIAKNWSRNKIAKGIDKWDNIKNRLPLKSLGLNKNNSDPNSSTSKPNQNSRKIGNNKYLQNLLSKKQQDVKKQQNLKNNASESNKEKLEEGSTVASSIKMNKAKESSTNILFSKKNKDEETNIKTNIQSNKGNSKLLLIVIISLVVIFMLLAVFIVNIIITKVEETIENTIIPIADTAEKIGNFIKGYGFNDSQTAFYEELNDLCKKYGCTNDNTGLNAPLLLSTIFYNETSGYGDTDFSIIDESIESDEDDSFGTQAIKDGIINKFFSESVGTIDENRITYTAGEIKRLKRLAKNQVSLGTGGTYIFDEAKYKKYLFDKYFENNPEYSSILSSNTGDKRTRIKEQIYNEILENEELYREIYMQNLKSSSESYTESCIGAIDSTLVSKLKKPVIIDDNINISFDDGYGFGTLNGKVHNGVDLNEKTANVKLGADVYSIANGKIVSISDSKCGENENCGKSIKISHNLIIDSKEYKFFSIYSNIVVESSISVNKIIGQGDKIGAIYNSQNNIEGLHFAFMDANEDSNGILIDPTNLFIPCKRGSSNLVGGTTEERVWNYFLAKGYNKFKIAAIMGNIYSESGFKSNNLENSCNIVYTDEAFTEAVNNGTIKKDEFMQSTRICTYYGDGRYGYGLAQWTDPGLKGAFYDKKVEYNVGIDDEGLQLDLLYEELEGNWNGPNNKNIWESASSESDIYTATEAYCNGFEVGTGCSSRGDAAMKYYNQFKNK